MKVRWRNLLRPPPSASGAAYATFSHATPGDHKIQLHILYREHHNDILKLAWLLSPSVDREQQNRIKSIDKLTWNWSFKFKFLKMWSISKQSTSKHIRGCRELMPIGHRSGNDGSSLAKHHNRMLVLALTEYQPSGWREPFGQINFGELFYRTIKMRKTGSKPHWNKLIKWKEGKSMFVQVIQSFYDLTKRKMSAFSVPTSAIVTQTKWLTGKSQDSDGWTMEAGAHIM